MKKLKFLLLAFLVTGCGREASLFKPNADGTPTAPPSALELAEQLIDQTKTAALIKEIDFTQVEAGFTNLTSSDISIEDDAPVLTMNSTVGLNQYIDTQETIQALPQASISIWFKTQDINAIQTLIWQGESTQNGWGGGANDPTKAELNINLNHWADTTGQVLSSFYGYNESADNTPMSGALLPVSYPVTRDYTNGTFSLTGQAVTLDTNWHHLVINISGQGTSEVFMETFVDGVSIGSGVGTQVDNSQWNTTLRIGRPGASTRYFQGKITNFLMFNRTLSQSEISALNLLGK